MKTLNLLACMLICLASVPAWAIGNGGDPIQAPESATALFSFDEAGVYATMEDLSSLEDYVKNHEGVSLEDLQAQNHALVANIEFTTPEAAAMNMMDPPLGIPSFIWGFCLGIIGLAVVYFITEDTDETKKALWGCLISSIISGVGGVIYRNL